MYSHWPGFGGLQGASNGQAAVSLAPISVSSACAICSQTWTQGLGPLNPAPPQCNTYHASEQNNPDHPFNHCVSGHTL